MTCARGDHQRQHCHKSHVVEEEPFDPIGGHHSVERHCWVDTACDMAGRVSDLAVLNEQNASKQGKEEKNDLDWMADLEEEMANDKEQSMV